VEIRRALDLDPFSVIMNRIHADILVDGRKFDEAIPLYKKTIELDPNFPTAHFFLGRAYEAKGMYDEAVAEYSKAQEINGVPPQVIKRLHDTYTQHGFKAYVQQNAEQSLAQKNFPPFVIATFFARLDRNDEALMWLEKGYEQRDFRMTLLSVGFDFDRLRSDPRFKELVRRIGLPE
jgi:tetratricopeptide (TPR) repeat protein